MVLRWPLELHSIEHCATQVSFHRIPLKYGKVLYEATTKRHRRKRSPNKIKFQQAVLTANNALRRANDIAEPCVMANGKEAMPQWLDVSVQGCEITWGVWKLQDVRNCWINSVMPIQRLEPMRNKVVCWKCWRWQLVWSLSSQSCGANQKIWK